MTLRHPSQQLVILSLYIFFLFILFCSTFFLSFCFICAEKQASQWNSICGKRDRVFMTAVVALLSQWDSTKNVWNGRCFVHNDCELLVTFLIDSWAKLRHEKKLKLKKCSCMQFCKPVPCDGNKAIGSLLNVLTTQSFNE